MKRILAMTLCLILAASALTACGADKNTDHYTESGIAGNSAEETAAEKETEASAEAGSAAETGSAAESENGTGTETESETETETEAESETEIETEAETGRESAAEKETEKPKPDRPKETQSGIAGGADEIDTAAAFGGITGGESMEEAQPIIVNRRVLIRHDGKRRWFSFTTGDLEGAEYIVTLENLSPESNDKYICMYQADGAALKPTWRNNDYYAHGADTPFCIARTSGTANSGMIDTLEPDTTYYLRLDGGKEADLILKISAPAAETEAEEETAEGAESNIVNAFLQNPDILPGASQSAAVSVPMNTTVTGSLSRPYTFFAFTTGENTETEYHITVVNRTVDSKVIYAWVIDEYGNAVDPTERNNDYYSYSIDTPVCVASSSGTANTGMVSLLNPLTTYYIRFSAEEGTAYTIRISSNEEDDAGRKTSSSFAEARKPLEETEEFYAGTNQTAATMLKTNTRYYGTMGEGGTAWVAFTTDAEESLPYTLTAQNLTEDSDHMHVCLIDEFGCAEYPDERENTYYAHAVDTPFCYAAPDGEENSGVSAPLVPDTVYYIRITGESGTDYMILIGEPEREAEAAPAEEERDEEAEPEGEKEEEPEEDLIIRVPFELNETQVRFVANEAVFLYPEEAKENLAPVAELILAYPGHPVLLAGTTATFGTQEDCADLSERRAEAVKELLVEFFGVPESQLITVGLGYVDDPFVRGRDIDSNGVFVETEGAKNRRVVVLDAESETARKILGN